MRTLVALAAIFVLVVTGLSWYGMDRLIAGIERITDLGLGGGADGAVDILLVGVDSRTDAHGNPLSDSERALLHAGDEVGTNTDTIVLIRVPNDGSSATAISIPRDTYVTIAGLGRGKINSAFGATKQGKKQDLLDQGVDESEAETSATHAGRQALVQSVADLTGITVDHYAEVSLLGFVLLTDAVGGVEVCLNNPVSEPMSGAFFSAGEQRLDGAQALSFVRQRHELDRGDLDRIVRQQVFMAQLVQQILSARTLSNPGKLADLSEAVGRTIVLDDDWDVLAFLRQLRELSAGSVTFETIPVADLNGMTAAGESIVRVDSDAVQAYVAAVVGEEPPSDSTPTVDPATVTVDVLNASAVAGLAGQVSASLAGAGFGTGQVANYTGDSVSGSRVLAASTSAAGAKAVARKLGGLPVLTNKAVPSDSVRVILASDYSGPGSSAQTLFTGDTTTTTATPVPPAPPIDAGQNGPTCVN